MSEGSFELEVQPALRTAMYLVCEYVAGVEDEGPFANRLVSAQEYLEDVFTYAWVTHEDEGVPWAEGLAPRAVELVVQRLN